MISGAQCRLALGSIYLDPCPTVSAFYNSYKASVPNCPFYSATVPAGYTRLEQTHEKTLDNTSYLSGGGYFTEINYAYIELYKKQ
jgi:hypothetical protein